MANSQKGSKRRRVCVVTTLNLDGIRKEFDYLYEDPDLYISKSSDEADFFLVDVSHPIPDLEGSLVQEDYAVDFSKCKPVLLVAAADGDKTKGGQSVFDVRSLNCTLPIHYGETELRPALDRFKKLVFLARRPIGELQRKQIVELVLTEQRGASR